MNSNKPKFKAWYGGALPVGEDQTIEAVLRGESRIAKAKAYCFRWGHSGYQFKGEIIMYREISE